VSLCVQHWASAHGGQPIPTTTEQDQLLSVVSRISERGWQYPFPSFPSLLFPSSLFPSHPLSPSSPVLFPLQESPLKSSLKVWGCCKLHSGVWHLVATNVTILLRNNWPKAQAVKGACRKNCTSRQREGGMHRPVLALNYATAAAGKQQNSLRMMCCMLAGWAVSTDGSRAMGWSSVVVSRADTRSPTFIKSVTSRPLRWSVWLCWATPVWRKTSDCRSLNLVSQWQWCHQTQQSVYQSIISVSVRWCK